MEYLFDLERAVEAVENRVPLGKPAMKILLTLVLLYTLLFAFRALTVDFIWPITNFIIGLIGHFRGTPPPMSFPKFNFPRIIPIGLAASLLGALIGLGNFALSRMYKSVKSLEAVVDDYRSLFWRPLSTTEEQYLREELSKIGKYSVRISPDAQTDCRELARSFYRLFSEVGWTLAQLAQGVTWEKRWGVWHHNIGEISHRTRARS